MADFGGDGDFGGGSSWSPENPDFASFGSSYGVCPVQPLGIGSYDFLAQYDRTLNSLVGSMALNAGVGPPVSTDPLAGTTTYYGLSGSVVTPVGGLEVDMGVYSDKYGLFGAYLGAGPSFGLPGASFGIAGGHTQSLAGDSSSASLGGGYGPVAISKGWSSDPTTGKVTGDQWSVALSVGPPVSAAATYTTTATTEFTSFNSGVFQAYVQFLNWVGYPGNSAGDWEF